MLKNQYLISVAVSALFLSAPTFAQNAAIVNGKAIPKAQLDKLVQKAGQADDPQVREQAREMLISKELILQEADKRGLIQKESVRDQLEQARVGVLVAACLLYTSPSPRDRTRSRMPSSA